MLGRSVYENREFGWRDRLRRLVGREDPADPGDKEIRFNDAGEPTLVTRKGECIGVRATDGSVIPAPELPRDPRSWPEEMWDADDDWGWRRLPRGWWL